MPSLNNYIKKLQDKAKKPPLKLLAMEITGEFRDNIGKDRINPKTIKEKGKTLYDKGLGIKSINYDKSKLTNFIISIGNTLKYMGYHLTGTKNLPERNWLIKPPQLDKIVQAWIRELMRK